MSLLIRDFDLQIILGLYYNHLCCPLTIAQRSCLLAEPPSLLSSKLIRILQILQQHESVVWGGPVSQILDHGGFLVPPDNQYLATSNVIFYFRFGRKLTLSWILFAGKPPQATAISRNAIAPIRLLPCRNRLSLGYRNGLLCLPRGS